MTDTDNKTTNPDAQLVRNEDEAPALTPQTDTASEAPALAAQVKTTREKPIKTARE